MSTDVRSFLGLFSVSRRLVPNVLRIAAPLNKKLAKGQPATFYGLTKNKLVAYDTRKEALISPPVWDLPMRGGQYTVDPDACGEQGGCVLLQSQPDGIDHPVGYFSRTFN